MTVRNSALAYSPDAAPGAAPALLAVRQVRLTDFRSYPRLRLDMPRAGGADRPQRCGQDQCTGGAVVPGAGPGPAPREARRARPPCRRRAAGLGGRGPVDTRGAATIGTGRDRPRRARRAASSGSTARTGASQTALGRVRLVWLTPEMDRLFIDGASERRRFLDRLVIGFDPEHAGDVAAYEQALRERARLLARGQHAMRPGSTRWRTAWPDTASPSPQRAPATVARLDRRRRGGRRAVPAARRSRWPASSRLARAHAGAGGRGTAARDAGRGARADAAGRHARPPGRTAAISRSGIGDATGRRRSARPASRRRCWSRSCSAQRGCRRARGRAAAAAARRDRRPSRRRAPRGAVRRDRWRWACRPG